MQKQDLLKFISDRKNVTFVEIENQFPEIKNDENLWFILKENIVLWGGWSKEAYQMLKDVAIPSPCSSLTYVIDGGRMNLPTAKTAGPYKKPHWLPAVFNVKQTAIDV